MKKGFQRVGIMFLSLIVLWVFNSFCPDSKAYNNDISGFRDSGKIEAVPMHKSIDESLWDKFVENVTDFSIGTVSFGVTTFSVSNVIKRAVFYRQYAQLCSSAVHISYSIIFHKLVI